MAFGGGMKTGEKIIEFYIELLILVAVLGASGVGIYQAIGFFGSNASLFGLAGLWAVGGIIYVLIGYALFKVLLNMVSKLTGK